MRIIEVTECTQCPYYYTELKKDLCIQYWSPSMNFGREFTDKELLFSEKAGWFPRWCRLKSDKKK